VVHKLVLKNQAGPTATAILRWLNGRKCLFDSAIVHLIMPSAGVRWETDIEETWDKSLCSSKGILHRLALATRMYFLARFSTDIGLQLAAKMRMMVMNTSSIRMMDMWVT
jgi:hypothetical protein